MNDRPASFTALTERPALPVPSQLRWQPLRLGLVEMFHYDSEEFWFRDGHLLLRGNNGTGKSKVLSLTLPFLFDAQLKSSRIEPDGDNSKKMSWNLLMNSYDRRTGYAWIEFGRRGDDGTLHYLTLGAGLSAVAARPQVDSWFFILEDTDNAPRINQEFRLMSEQRVVLTRERLREALDGRGQIFDTAAGYRRAVDERLFHLGVRRYDALMDTLIQLRQPQLSKKPDEAALSNALTEALPPLAPELLGDVAEALGQLEEDRRQLEDYQALAKAVDRFDQRYRIYAGTQSRRQARILRQAQTEFDNASRSRGEAQARLETAEADEAGAQIAHDAADVALKRERARLETLQSGAGMQDANRLEAAENDAAARQRAFAIAADAVAGARRRLDRSIEETQAAARRVAATEHQIAELRRACIPDAEAAGVASLHLEHPFAALDAATLGEWIPAAFESARSALGAVVSERRDQIATLRRRDAEVAAAEAQHAQRQTRHDEARETAEAAAERREQADADVEREGQTLVQSWQNYLTGLKQLRIGPDDEFAVLAALAEWVVALDGDNPARQRLQAAQQQASERLAARRVALEGQQQALLAERTALDDERLRLESGLDTVPPQPHTRAENVRNDRDGAPLWQLVDFRAALTTQQRAGLEAALEAAGLLDAWISPDGRMQARDGGAPLFDAQMLARPSQSTSLADWLLVDVPPDSMVPATVVGQLLSGIACADEDPVDSETWIAADGRFRLGALAGAWSKPEAVYIGYAARAAARARRLAEIAARLTQLADALAVVQEGADQLGKDQNQAAEEWRLAPSDEGLRKSHLAAAAAAREADIARQRWGEAAVQRDASEQALQAARQRRTADATDLRLPASPNDLAGVEVALGSYQNAQIELTQAIREARQAFPNLRKERLRESEARDGLTAQEERCAVARIEAEQASSRFEVLRDTIGAEVEELRRQLVEARAAVEAGDTSLALARGTLIKSGQVRAVAQEQASNAIALFERSSDARAEAISKFQQFTSTGLFAAALPQLEVPDMRAIWTIDPALKRPTMSDLRDSGSLEQDADAIIFVYRDAYYLERQTGLTGEQEATRIDRLIDAKDQIEVIVAKQRNGPTGTLKMFCDIGCNAVRDEDFR